MQSRAVAYDQNGSAKHEVAIVNGALKEFRRKYQFAENLRTIEWLDPDKLFRINPDGIGEFFSFLENHLNPHGYALPSNSNLYRNARLQIKELKDLLRTAVDSRRSLAKKVDAPWERIGGWGQDKQLAKKIIFCFNYESGCCLPIFSNQHLRHFTNRVADYHAGQTRFLSMGQEYQYYTEELIKTKNSLPITKDWDNLYFAQFLYTSYPPPDCEPAGFGTSGREKTGLAVSNEQLELQGFLKLLAELQKQREIDGEQFREYRDLWTKQPSERDALVERLKRLLKMT